MLFNLFNKKKERKLVVTFTETAEGITTRITMDGGIGVMLVQDAATQLKHSLNMGIKRELEKARFNKGDRRGIIKFTNSLTIRDIMKTNTLKY